MNKKTSIIILICTVLCINVLHAQEFTWQIALVKDGRQGVAVNDAVKMEGGERFNFNLWADKSCYVYIVAEMASGSMLPVFDKRIPAGQETRTGTIRLQPSSSAQQEKFYVVASLEEQVDLKEVIDIYNKEKSPENAQMLKNILFLVSDPVSTNIGIPVDMKGGIRGAGKAPSDTYGVASEYRGSSVYAKTIVINH